VLQEQMGWWIVWAVEVRVVAGVVVCHISGYGQRVDRVPIEYPWPLVSFRLLSPVGHFHSPPDTAAVVKYAFCTLYYFNLMVHVSKQGRPVTLACQPLSLRPYDFKGPQLSTCTPPTCLSIPTIDDGVKKTSQSRPIDSSIAPPQTTANTVKP
jgi:hypothetical protein